MNFLVKILPILLNWLYGKVEPLILDLLRRKKINDDLEEKQDERTKLAREIDEVKKQMLSLRDENKEIPQELKDKLRELSRRLINS